MKDILYFNTLDDIKIVKMMRTSNKSLNKHNYKYDYLTFEALDDSVFTVEIWGEKEIPVSLSYSLDNGKTWTTSTDVVREKANTLTVTTPTILAGNKVLWKGDNVGCRLHVLGATGRFNVMGNIMSVYYEDFIHNENNIWDYIFESSFAGSGDMGGYRSGLQTLISAKNLILPEETTSHCCAYMFLGCINLTDAPILRASILLEYCYYFMFKDCTSLNKVTMLATNVSATRCLGEWLLRTAKSGVITKLATTNLPLNSYDGIPEGWTVNNIGEVPEETDPGSTDMPINDDPNIGGR